MSQLSDEEVQDLLAGGEEARAEPSRTDAILRSVRRQLGTRDVSDLLLGKLWHAVIALLGPVLDEVKPPAVEESDPEEGNHGE